MSGSGGEIASFTAAAGVVAFGIAIATLVSPRSTAPAVAAPPTSNPRAEFAALIEAGEEPENAAWWVKSHAGDEAPLREGQTEESEYGYSIIVNAGEHQWQTRWQ